MAGVNPRIMSATMDEVKKQHPDWSEDRIFEEAAKRAEKVTEALSKQTQAKAPIQKKESNLKRLSRWIKMGVLGSRYKSEWQRRREQGGGALAE